MQSKKLIVCLDVIDKRVTKGVQFKGNIDVGDPVEMASRYSDEGVDELVVYDIMASAEGRAIDLDLVKSVAAVTRVPLTVGGGLRDLKDIEDAMEAGAQKVSINSLAVLDPSVIADASEKFGKNAVMLAIDAKFVGVSEQIPSGYEVFIQGARRAMGLDAIQWAQEAQRLGAGEVCLNSIDADGTKEGYDLVFTDLMAKSLEIPVIASGGAGTLEHIQELFEGTAAQAALVASMLHFNEFTVSQIKKVMH
ncbi:MAG: imidazole glycerol phosphate synthase subunit HisF [Fibrobacter sp.]|jgi:cyclase|nr:imidazole glycerol phosphate synthase subunit HisF [Fibrobacter sp.]